MRFSSLVHYMNTKRATVVTSQSFSLLSCAIPLTKKKKKKYCNPKRNIPRNFFQLLFNVELSLLICLVHLSIL